MMCDRAEPDALAGVAHAGCQAGPGAEMTSGREPGDLTDLGDHEQGGEDTDSRDACEDGDARVVLGARLDLPLHNRELAVEVGDQRQQGLEPATGRLREREPGEELPSLGPEEFGASALDPLAGKYGMDT